MKKKGLFITIEGNEGSGKGTLIRDLEKWFLDNEIKAFFTREPGGSKIGEKIRSILIDRGNITIHPMTELLLYIANRCQNINLQVSKKMEEGCVVVSDRCLDSSVAYQGAGRQIDKKIVNRLNKLVIGRYLPDITIILIVNPEVGLKRKLNHNSNDTQTGELDRFEIEKLEFHKKLHDEYLALSKTHKRFVLIDTTNISPKEVFESAVSTIKEKLTKAL